MSETNSETIRFSSPGDPDKFPAKNTVPVSKWKARRERFPDAGFPSQLGRYGMFRTLEGHRLAVRRCLKELRRIESTFDALYVQGLSGVIPAAVIAYVLKKELLILRKRDLHHGGVNGHGMPLEGNIQTVDGARYIILDDFICGAYTLKRLLASLPSNGKLVGLLLYGEPRSNNEYNGGYAKEFTITGRETSQYKVVRRGKNSMLFDLICPSS